MRQPLPFLILCTAVLLFPSAALAFILDRTPSSVPIRWNLAGGQPNISGGKVLYLINKRGSEDVTFANVTTAVEAAFGTWHLANGSVIDFMRVSDPSSSPDGTIPNRTDSTNEV